MLPPVTSLTFRFFYRPTNTIDIDALLEAEVCISEICREENPRISIPLAFRACSGSCYQGSHVRTDPERAYVWRSRAEGSVPCKGPWILSIRREKGLFKYEASSKATRKRFFVLQVLVRQFILHLLGANPVAFVFDDCLC